MNGLSAKKDFDDKLGIEWAALIGDIKKFLLSNPSKSNELQEAFRENHIRIPVIDYTNAVNESGYLERVQDWIHQHKWAKFKFQTINIDYLLTKAKRCELLYKLQLEILLKKPISNEPFDAKRVVPKVRYLAGRLLYLLSRDSLMQCFPKLKNIPEFFLIYKTMEALATRDVTDIVQMGVNAAQSTAQLLRVDQGNVKIDKSLEITTVIEQSLAILTLNGLKFDFSSTQSELEKFAKGENILQLMNADDLFVRKLACLHGVADARHQVVIDSSFDRNEDLALDILNLIHNSKSN